MSLKLALILIVSLISSGSPSCAQGDSKNAEGLVPAKSAGAGLPMSKAALAGAQVRCAEPDHGVAAKGSGGPTAKAEVLTNSKGFLSGGKEGGAFSTSKGSLSGKAAGTFSTSKGSLSGKAAGTFSTGLESSGESVAADLMGAGAPAGFDNCHACCEDSEESEDCLSSCRAARQDGKRLKASGKLANVSPDPFEILTPVEEVEAPRGESFEPCPQYNTTIYHPPESEQCGGTGARISTEENAK